MLVKGQMLKITPESRKIEALKCSLFGYMSDLKKKYQVKTSAIVCMVIKWMIFVLQTSYLFIQWVPPPPYYLSESYVFIESWFDVVVKLLEWHWVFQLQLQP